MSSFVHQILEIPARILVVGDIMLDRYLEGTTERISPEAPVPVVKITRRRSVPGGAANAAANLAGLGAETHLIGYRGEDEPGQELEQTILTYGIRAHLICGSRPTTCKTRVVSVRQQLVRLDEEEIAELSPAEITAVLDRITLVQAQGLAGILLSDYGKGFAAAEICRALAQVADTLGIPFVVDPKGTDWEKYAGATLITPNVRELGEALGRSLANQDEIVAAAGWEALERFDLPAVLITRSAAGMTLVCRGEIVHHIPAETREVFDVSGAGDTVVAALLRCLAAGADRVAAVRAANIAAGIAVGHSGTYRLNQTEWLQSLEAQEQGQDRRDLPSPRILEQQGAAALATALRSRGDRIVFTNGCFDLLHPGHLSTLTQARALGDVLIVGLNSDTSVQRLKGSQRPIVGEWDRATLLMGLEVVDYVILFDDDTPADLIAALQPDVLVKGGDYAIEEIVGRDHAGVTLAIPLVEGHSTTRIVDKIQHPIQSEIQNPDGRSSQHPLP